MTGLVARWVPGHSLNRPDVWLAALLGIVAVAVAFVATERLAGHPPIVAIGLGLLVALPAWMVFSGNRRLTLAVLLLYLGLMDGVLKLHLDVPAATLGRDLLLYAIVLGAVVRFALDRRQLRLPPLTGYVLAFCVIVAVQVLNPSTDGIVRGIAAMRPHLEFVPLFFLGYVVMREVRHLWWFLVLIGVVGALNGIVSLIQFNLTPEELASWGPGYEALVYGTGGVSGRTFVDAASGESFVRPFGLGQDTGFGGHAAMLAVPAVVALIATADRRWVGRVGILLAVGVVLGAATSQTRSALAATVVALLAFGALALAPGRRAMTLLGIAVVVALAAVVAPALSRGDHGTALDRYASIAPGRVLDATAAARGGSLRVLPSYVEAFPLGAGLGQVGPASSFANPALRGEPLSGETELNFLVVELGVTGLAVFLALIARLLALSLRVRSLRDGQTRVLLAGCAAPLFGIAAAGIAGPVSASTPTAPYFWFTAGVLAFWLARPTPAPENHAPTLARRCSPR